jgi:shikimate dehydrogenase
VAAPTRTYEDLLDWMACNQQVRGMVITSHKIGLFRAGSGRFAAADRLPATLGEISAVRRTPSGDLLAYATDPLSARAAAAELNLGTSGGEIICFGAGGAAVALAAALTLPGTELTRDTRLCPSFGEGPTDEKTARKLVKPGPFS